MKFNKKAISPVVATALLLVVAVVAVVGFQSWFTTYQSGVNVKVEQESAAGSALIVERLQWRGGGDDATIYVKNAATSNVTISEFKITKDGALACENTTGGDVYGNNVTRILIDGQFCGMTQDDSYDVVLVTNSGVFSSKQIAR